jgi:hypothetical protein
VKRREKTEARPVHDDLLREEIDRFRRHRDWFLRAAQSEYTNVEDAAAMRYEACRKEAIAQGLEEGLCERATNEGPVFAQRPPLPDPLQRKLDDLWRREAWKNFDRR